MGDGELMENLWMVVQWDALPLIVCVVGIVLLLGRRARFPVSSLLGIGGLALCGLLYGWGALSLLLHIPRLLFERNLQVLMTVTEIARGLLSAAATAALFLAVVLAGRGRKVP